MPAAIAHYLLARKALDLYRKKGGPPVVGDAFLWGAQGPDFLFYHIPFPWRDGRDLNSLGSRLHKGDPTQLFFEMRGYAARNSADELVHSYLLGFLCHYTFDRTAHPFVYAGIRSLREQCPGRSEGFLHCQIESALDVILLRYENAGFATDFDLKKTVPKNPDVQAMIADLYVFILRKLFGGEVEAKAVLQATNDCRRVSGLLNDRTSLKKQLIERMEKRTGKYLCSCFLRGLCEDGDYDYANVLASPWRWPPESPLQRTESFLDLYEFSIYESVGFMLDFFENGSLEKMTGHIPFS
jgi:hypothetical protein